MHGRNIGLQDLNWLRERIDSPPDVPEDESYEGFGSFKLWGHGKYPKTFLLPGQVATG
jgi:hypothetical protein